MVASQDPRACRQDESPSLAAFAPGLGGRCRLVAQPASGFARCRNPRCHAPVCHPQATGDLARLPACRAAVLAGQPAALPASGHQHGRARVALVGLDQRYILPRVQPGAAFPLNRLRHLGRRSRRERLALAALEPARIRAVGRPNSHPAGTGIGTGTGDAVAAGDAADDGVALVGRGGGHGVAGRRALASDPAGNRGPAPCVATPAADGPVGTVGNARGCLLRCPGAHCPPLCAAQARAKRHASGEEEEEGGPARAEPARAAGLARAAPQRKAALHHSRPGVGGAGWRRHVHGRRRRRRVTSRDNMRDHPVVRPCMSTLFVGS